MSASEGFAGLRVLSLESRRAAEMAELVRRHGGEPVSAPSMREVPLEDDPAALELAERLRAGSIDVALFLTGVGTRTWIAAVEDRVPRAALAAALGAITTVARGPKPRAALAELGVRATLEAAEPNTWKELLEVIDGSLTLAGRTVAVQEYGAENPELMRGLAERGAAVLRVPVYRWALPLDLGPLRRAIDELAGGRIDVVLFTSATQVDHLARVHGASIAPLLERALVASIGPVCSDALRRRGVRPDVEPEHPKMGWLVRTAAEAAKASLAAKRTSRGDITRSTI